MNTEKLKYLDQAIQWARNRAASDIRSVHDEFEDTQLFKNNNSDEHVQPDLSFKNSSGVKSYTEISLKTDTPQKLVTRWKLLSLLASLRNGKLFLLTPKGHKMFTQKLVSQYGIQAEIYSI